MRGAALERRRRRPRSDRDLSYGALAFATACVLAFLCAPIATLMIFSFNGNKVMRLAFDEIPVTFILTGRDNTLPMYIWSAIRRGITPEIDAIGTVIIRVSIILIVVSAVILIQPQERRREP